MGSSLTPTECWREYLYKITILCNNNNIQYEDFIKHNDFTDRGTFINSINKKRNNCKAVSDLELTFYNNESYVFHGDGFIFCCSNFFFKMCSIKIFGALMVHFQHHLRFMLKF